MPERQSCACLRGQYTLRKIITRHSNHVPRLNLHSPAAPPAPHFPRFRALALFGRRPPQRLDSLVMPASENLHNNGSGISTRCSDLRPSWCTSSSRIPSSRGRRHEKFRLLRHFKFDRSAPRACIAKSRSRCDGLTFKLVSAMPRGPKMCSCKYFSSRSPLTFSIILPAKSKAQRGGGWRGKASAAALYRVQLFSRRNTQSETASPLLMSACTRPSIMKVGDTWIPFWRAYLQCHLISRSRSRIAKASESLAPL